MKKLLIAFAIVASACFARAAAVDWMVCIGDDSLAGMNWYVLNGAYSDQLSTLLTNGNTSGFESALSTIGSANYVTGQFVAGDYGTALDTMADAAGSLSVLIVDSALTADSTFYYAEGSTAGYTYEAPNPSPASMEWITTAAFTESTIGSSEVVPEPTSGLLMLLGLAGLALKRKKA